MLQFLFKFAINMKKLIIISAILFTSPFWRGFEMILYAQVPVMVNIGGDIYSANDTIFANGGISNLMDANGKSGTFRNSGEVYVTNGNWTNSAGNAAFTNTSGLPNTNSTIDFYMIGVGGTQFIQGTSVTGFHTLNLIGTGVTQLGINAVVKDTLNLNDLELATGSHILSVTNPELTSVLRTSGFVSSLDSGGLERKTASSVPYFFPVGVVNKFRPVEITPENSSLNDYTVGMINGSATTDFFPLTQKETNINFVNPSYFHEISRAPGGSASASITMYYDEAQDGRFSSMGHWQNQPQWEDITADPTAGNYGLNGAMVKQNWNFSSSFKPFALVKLLNECGEMFVPNAFSPDNNGENDIEYVYGKCIQKIYFAIYDRWGQKVFETTDMKQGWDGSFKGKEMNTGVFVYYLTATLTTGETVTKKGNISLFR